MLVREISPGALLVTGVGSELVLVDETSVNLSTMSSSTSEVEEELDPGGPASREMDPKSKLNSSPNEVPRKAPNSIMLSNPLE